MLPSLKKYEGEAGDWCRNLLCKYQARRRRQCGAGERDRRVGLELWSARFATSRLSGSRAEWGLTAWGQVLRREERDRWGKEGQ